MENCVYFSQLNIEDNVYSYTKIRSNYCNALCQEVTIIDSDYLKDNFIMTTREQHQEYSTTDYQVIKKGIKLRKIQNELLPRGYNVFSSVFKESIKFKHLSQDAQIFIKSTFTNSSIIDYTRICNLMISDKVKKELKKTINSKNKYTLFRGLSWETPAEFTKLYSKILNRYDTIILSLDCISSWSSHFCEAKNFANMKRYGIIFEYNPDLSNILVDFRTIKDTKHETHIKEFNEIMLLPGEYTLSIKAIILGKTIVKSTQDWK
jgi:hypothetical protein